MLATQTLWHKEEKTKLIFYSNSLSLSSYIHSSIYLSNWPILSISGKQVMWANLFFHYGAEFECIEEWTIWLDGWMNEWISVRDNWLAI